jgi:hypothetical protein
MSPGNFDFVARHPARMTDDFWFELDEYRREPDGAQLMLAHIRVHHWSKEVFKQIFKEWKVFRECVKCPLYAVPETADDKWAKFVTALGFKPLISEIVCENGDKRPIYIHTV